MFGFFFHVDGWLMKDQVQHVLREVILTSDVASVS